MNPDILIKIPPEVWTHIITFTGDDTINLLLCNKYFLSLVPLIRYQKNIYKHLFKNNYLDIIKYVDYLKSIKSPITRNYFVFNYCHDRLFKMCCKLGYIDLVKYMVNRGFNIKSEKNRYVGKAAKFNHLSVVKYLVRKGCQIKNDYHYAVRAASKNGHLKILKYLVRHGGNIKAFDNHAIKLACENNHLKVVKYLIKKGADIHADNDYCLKYTSLYDNKFFIKIFLKFKPNVENMSRMFEKALLTNNNILIDYCLNQNLNLKQRFLLVKIIDSVKFNQKIDQGVIHKNISSTINYDQLIHKLFKNIGPNEKVFLYGCKNNKLEIIKSSFSSDFNKKIYDEVFKIICSGGNLKIIKYIIKKGVKIEINNEMLKLIYFSGNVKIIKYLESRKINTNIYFLNANDFEFILKDEHYEMAKYLLSKGFVYYFDKGHIINILNNLCVKFMYSYTQVFYQILKFLIENKINLLGYANKLLYLAIYNDDLDMIKYLQQNGINIIENKYIIFTCYHGKINILKYLISLGTIIDNNCIIKSFKGGHLNVIKYLEEQNHFIDNDLFLIKAAKNRRQEIIEYLINKTTYSNAIINNALYYACKYKNLDMVNCLIEYKINKLHDNNFTENLINTSVEIFEYLTSVYGFEKIKKYLPNNILEKSIYEGKYEYVQLLIKKGFVPNNIIELKKFIENDKK
ncbi:ankyrin repeat protein [Saudi moumouvirus]|nr:ankyrin repeat protein [Saudi moumouvirus]